MRLKALLVTVALASSVVAPAHARTATKPDLKREQAAAKQYARATMLATYGWGQSEFVCLDEVWEHESHWNYHSSAGKRYLGIPQLNAKLVTEHYTIERFMSDPKLQIRAGLRYIYKKYDSPCGVIKTVGHNSGY